MTIRAYIDSAASLLDERQESRRAMTIETSGVLADGDEANVTVHNLSSAGLLIETDVPLGVGEILAIDLPETGPVDAAIVWKSEHLYGCAFAQALPAASPDMHSAPRLDALGGGAFGAQINRLRRERGMTLAQVASALGVSKPTVWAWEKGKARPLPERIKAIAAVLGVSIEDLAPTGERPAHGHQMVEDCRARIAHAFATEVRNIRIMIEV